ncbi:MAG: translocation/assembly module TamB domain-containing protein [Tannerella sp.]|jgi:hypothetical protein|nr:translocation/assembly module TamB domain-containing protein [Tannerella sp.]
MQKERSMKGKWKKGIKRLLLAGIIVVGAVLLAIATLYVPAVQDFAVKEASRRLSAATGLDIHIDRLRLSFPLNLHVQNVLVTDAAHDTLLLFTRLEAAIQPLPLLKYEIVPADDIRLENARFDTGTLIEGMAIRGDLDRLILNVNHIRLPDETLHLDSLLLEGADVTLRIDSTLPPDDEPEVPVNWQFFLDRIHLRHIAFHCRMPSDSIRADSFFEDVMIADGNLDLGAQRYAVLQCLVSGASAGFDRDGTPAGKGFDPSHVALSDLNVGADSLLYFGRTMHVNIRHFSVREQSGLEIMSMDGSLQSDSTTLSVPRWSLRTRGSTLSAQLSLPWQALSANPQDNLRALLTASLDRRDISILAGNAFDAPGQRWPDTLILCRTTLEGNMERLNISKLYSELPGVFKVEAAGVIEKMSDPAARSGNMHLTVSTYDANVFRALTQNVYDGKFRLPDNMQLEMKTALNRGEYRLEMSLAEQQGKVRLDGRYHAAHQTYSVAMKIDSLEPVHFLPYDSVTWLAASLHAEGMGTNPFAASTWTQFDGELPEIRYKDAVLTGLSFDGSLKDNHMQAALRSAHPYAQADVSLDGSLREKDISGILIVNVDSLDLYGLQLAEQPFSHSFQIFSEFETDLAKRHRFDITLGNWEMLMRRRRMNPKTLTLHVDSREDRSLVSFHVGDLSVMLQGNTDLGTLAEDFSVLSADAVHQFETDTTLDLSRLRPLFPAMTLNVEAQRDNPVYNYLQENSIFFDRFALDASLSPENGLQMDASLYNIIRDTTKIDTVRLQIRQDSTALQYTGEVVKNKFRNQEPYRASLTGKLQDNMADAEVTYRNRLNETGLHAGISARKMSSGVKLQLFPERPVIAYLPFRVNADNYIHIKTLSDISANLRLEGENDASVWLHSQEENGAMQELSLEVNQINLKQISESTGNLPLMQGIANFSMRYVPMSDTYMLVADAGVDNLIYQDSRIGELLLNGVYLPVEGGKHRVDMHFFHDRDELSRFSLLYQPSRQAGGRIDGVWDINGFPLSMLNPVLGSNTMRLNGALHGNAQISGTDEAPVINGFMQLDTAAAYITAAGTQVRFDGQKVNIEDSKILFNKYNLFTSGNNPFIIDGSVDISNPGKSEADLTLTARDMQLLNVPKNSESIVYGRLSVDLNSTVKGPLNTLKMRGDLHMLGSTNMSYIMKESPLATSDRMADLVTFSYFRDTIPRSTWLLENRMPREFASVSGLDMLLTVRIDPAVKLKVDLDETGNDRVEMKGGGDLSLQYTPHGEMLLNGRYTFSGGLIKYNMPIISNKTLNIKENSYVEWTGDLFDPYLSLKATERIRSSVSTDGQRSHIVNFEAGIALRQRIEDLSLQFTLDALDDVAVQNQLVAMGTEERSKQAVSLLLTGMYLAGDGADRTKLDMNSALNTFLQSEINHITGSLLKDVDFNFGMERFDDASGFGQRTDYSFRFSKRFYNDRFNIILGGQVSTGDALDDNSSMFINDASIEYRLDTEGSRYAKLFYNRQYDSLLEGEISKYGLGVVFRRKMRRLGDLFVFRRKKIETVTENEVHENGK